MRKPFPDLGTDLLAAGYKPPSYSAMWQTVARGGVPGVTRSSNRLYFDSTNIHAIAEALGLQAEVKVE
jgi:hypothetical protein